MKNHIKEILINFQNKKECVKMNFKNDEWRKDIPGEPGWYVIKTDTPVEVFGLLVEPQKGIYHYNLKKRCINNNKHKFIICQDENKKYVVYNGHAKNLKARAREHDRGHNKTACLALRKYQDLIKYNWYFYYLPISALDISLQDSKLLRIAVEQAWRAEFGWPILCEG